MSSQETRELVERAEELAARAAEGSPDAEARFDEALARLRRSAGIEAEPRRPHSTFGEAVRKTMLDRNWVVASHPNSRHTSIQPDFLVQASDRRLLVEAKSRDVSRRSIERAAAMLMQAVEPFGADDAYIVVPDGQKAADLDVPVQVLTLSELRALA